MLEDDDDPVIDGLVQVGQHLVVGSWQEELVLRDETVAIHQSRPGVGVRNVVSCTLIVRPTACGDVENDHGGGCSNSGPVVGPSAHNVLLHSHRWTFMRRAHLEWMTLVDSRGFAAVHVNHCERRSRVGPCGERQPSP